MLLVNDATGILQTIYVRGLFPSKERFPDYTQYVQVTI